MQAAAHAAGPRKGGRNTERLGEQRRGARPVRGGMRFAAAYGYVRNSILKDVIGDEECAASGSSAVKCVDDEALVGRVLERRGGPFAFHCGSDVVLSMRKQMQLCRAA